MDNFKNADGKIIVQNMVKTIQTNKEYLSEVDGAIGDGDHGINMNKGFTICGERLKDSSEGFTEGLDTLGNILFSEIGGSMGPLYGTLFMDMAEAAEEAEIIDAPVFGKMITAAADGVQDLAGAQVGDKTLVDALVPAKEAYLKAVSEGKSFAEALAIMKKAADDGKQSTIDMVAKLGRASRLGERSRGVLDAGATSCSLLLGSIADSITELLK